MIGEEIWLRDDRFMSKILRMSVIVFWEVVRLRAKLNIRYRRLPFFQRRGKGLRRLGY